MLAAVLPGWTTFQRGALSARSMRSTLFSDESSWPPFATDHHVVGPAARPFQALIVAVFDVVPLIVAVFGIGVKTSRGNERRQAGSGGAAAPSTFAATLRIAVVTRFLLSVTVRTTGYVPDTEKRCDAAAPVAAVPSPKFHAWETMAASSPARASA